MDDLTALAELREHVEACLGDARAIAEALAERDAAGDALRLAREDVLAHEAQLRVLERCREMLDAGFTPAARLADALNGLAQDMAA